MRLRHFGHTDVGQRRAHNEDAYLADPELGLFIVADGVGGRQKGEIASQETVQFIWDWVKRELPGPGDTHAERTESEVNELCRIMRGAVQNACYMVHSMGELDPERRGMSTTASAFMVAGSVGIVGQVGDSRVYLARNGQISQLTEDHTLINYQLKHGMITEEEAKHSKVKNVITRAVGHKDYVEVDVMPIGLQPNDRIFLCSDGLHGYLDSVEDVGRLLVPDIEQTVLDSVRYANERGGKDNITALLVELLPDEY